MKVLLFLVSKNNQRQLPKLANYKEVYAYYTNHLWQLAVTQNPDILNLIIIMLKKMHKFLRVGFFNYGSNRYFSIVRFF